MKTNWWKVTILGGVVCALLLAVVPCVGAEEEEDDWWEDRPRLHLRRGGAELTEERIEHLMARLREANPERAKELEQLREEDPEKFRAGLREMLRERMERERAERPEGERPGRMRRRGPEPAPEPGMGPGPAAKPVAMRRPGDLTRRRLAGQVAQEFLEWLKEHYPEKADQLEELKERDPELYHRRLRLGYGRYGRIAKLYKENPELAGVMKEKLELNEQRDRLLRELRTEDDEDARKAIVNELKAVVSSKYDLIVRERELEYEGLLERLRRLQEEVEARGAEVEKWKDAASKESKVEARLEELVAGTEKFRWD